MHRLHQRHVGFEPQVHDAFVGVAVGWVRLLVVRVVVAVFEPVPADAAAGFEQAEGEVLVEPAAVRLGLDDASRRRWCWRSPESMPLAYHSVIDEGLAGPLDPVLHLLRDRATTAW